MSTRVALRVVDTPVPGSGGPEILTGSGRMGGHSLHYSVQIPGVAPVEAASSLIQRFTRPGQVIVDLFSADGTVALEAALAGRVPVAICLDSLGLKLTQAKVAPADITEVTLWLQKVNLKRPVDLSQYGEVFSPFFDVNTYRELANLQRYIHEFPDRTSRFIELATAGILHGHSAGFLSVYTFPQVSLSPAEQRQLNAKRRHSPDYRALIPRILRKSAALLRDGIPSALYQCASHGRLGVAAPGVQRVAVGSHADLVFCNINLYDEVNISRDMWLKLWFFGLSSRDVFQQAPAEQTHTARISNILRHAERILAHGGRLILYSCLRQTRGKECDLFELLQTLSATEQLFHSFEIEGMFINPHKAIKLGEQPDDFANAVSGDQAVVLRRR